MFIVGCQRKCFCGKDIQLVDVRPTEQMEISYVVVAKDMGEA